MSYPTPNDNVFQPPVQTFGNPHDPPQPASQSGCLWGCVIGGAIGFLVVILVCAGAAYYVVANAKSLAVGVARNFAVQMVEASELPADDKQQVVTQIDRVVDEYKKGKINEKDLENIFAEIQNSPLLAVTVVYFIEKQYLDRSGLTAEEKENAKLQLQRVIRGRLEKKIEQSDIDALLAPLMQMQPDGTQKVKEQLTDDEIKKLIADSQKLADDAQVPNEKFEVDIGDEVKRIVDQGLSKHKD
ncbi:hypothetical protein ETAA8_14930 [Anatilimnocola aggregata]|uniref:Uncharacterized protein n=1 Tax=Anatilimnocola aggregata TaxID=2528021 RepID=A0A517Y894_9BACT|nr:hypothetical protein [Anatilimnocola aggregata]QDU26415.1 hypothetical protein ETAA8_14930 [Anatilimnocola aggregata]